MVNPENIRTSNITQTKQFIFINLKIYICVHVCITTINENGGHELERKKGGVDERV